MRIKSEAVILSVKSKRIFYVTAISLILVMFKAVAAEEPIANEVMPDPREWGIHNNCVSLSRIKNVKVENDNLVVLELYGGKKAIMRFKRPCRGLKLNGYIHSSQTNSICAKFDSIRVIEWGNICLIDTIEPMIEPEEVEDTK